MPAVKLRVRLGEGPLPAHGVELDLLVAFSAERHQAVQAQSAKSLFIVGSVVDLDGALFLAVIAAPIRLEGEDSLPDVLPEV